MIGMLFIVAATLMRKSGIHSSSTHSTRTPPPSPQKVIFSTLSNTYDGVLKQMTAFSR